MGMEVSDTSQRSAGAGRSRDDELLTQRCREGKIAINRHPLLSSAWLCCTAGGRRALLSISLSLGGEVR